MLLVTVRGDNQAGWGDLSVISSPGYEKLEVNDSLADVFGLEYVGSDGARCGGRQCAGTGTSRSGEPGG
jgi:hypothetical protein